MREQFIETSFKGMADHNVLEFLLFFGIPQKDTNELAHRLIDRFGSFGEVLRADFDELRAVKGMTENAACMLKLILPAYQRYDISMHAKRPIFETAEAVEEFMRPYYLDTTRERVFLLCLDSKHQLLSLRCLNEGSFTDVQLDLRTLASIVLETKSSSVILVHNHPNGMAKPSLSDIKTTGIVYKFLQTLKVQLLEHIILTETKMCAMTKLRQCCHIFYDVEPIGPMDDDEDD